ncbi:MAG: hypothetical protein KIT11_07975 [Fimbriimonadaceae bacterium]|nr:hypothetical protein [Fimbriimonadaceae bacterium]QYK56291.1 MAG: hypothetical protein KF733_02170 [Fimbriimonadaceae bacterium]
MNATLRGLLEGAIDYAGLFPPAKLDLPTAYREYRSLLSGPDGWIVNRFVCGVGSLPDLAGLVGEHEEVLAVDVIGTPLGADPGARVRADADLVLAAAETGRLEVAGYEVRVDPTAAHAAGGALKKLEKLIGEVPIYAEVPFGEGQVDAMQEVISAWDEVGFKARTGGTSADQFPTVADLAAFIAEVAALEAPFKFTAGLHEPLRYLDVELNVKRHGFLNAMGAGALAVTNDLSQREIEEVLGLEQAEAFAFFEEKATIGGHTLTLDGIEEFWGVFGGFGSCSVSEPIEGLRRMGVMKGALA